MTAAPTGLADIADRSACHGGAKRQPARRPLKLARAVLGARVAVCRALPASPMAGQQGWPGHPQLGAVA